MYIARDGLSENSPSSRCRCFLPLTGLDGRRPLVLGQSGPRLVEVGPPTKEGAAAVVGSYCRTCVHAASKLTEHPVPWLVRFHSTLWTY